MSNGFHFGSADYRWCPECAANIRAEAYYCPYCHVPVGSNLLRNRAAEGVSRLISEAAGWLPDFEGTLAQLPPEFRRRVDEADAADTVAPEGTDPSAYRQALRNGSLCPPFPPRPQALGLLMDILISLEANGHPIGPICRHDRLCLLELTAADVKAEYELRLAERESNTKCRHCSEFILNNRSECRFCGGDEENKPAEIGMIIHEVERYDPILLKRILAWEAAYRAIHNEPPLAPEILTKQGVTHSEIEEQIAHLTHNHKHLPISPFRERARNLGLHLGYYNDSDKWDSLNNASYFELQDISMLAAWLSSFRRQPPSDKELSVVIYEHALARWMDNPFYTSQRTPLLRGLATAQLGLNNKDEYKRLSNAADQELLRTADALPKDQADFLKESIKERPKPLFNRDPDIQSEDPEKRLAALERMQERFIQDQERRLKRLGSMLPGFEKAFSGITDRSNAALECTKVSLQAEIASKKGDHVTACKLYEQALSLSENDILRDGRKVQLLCALGKEKSLLPEGPAARQLFTEAIKLSDDICEARGGSHWATGAYYDYACFLLDQGQYDQASEALAKALKHYNNTEQTMIADGFMKEEDKAGGTARIFEAYARLSEALGDDAKAAEYAERAATLKEKEERKKLDVVARTLASENDL